MNTPHQRFKYGQPRDNGAPKRHSRQVCHTGIWREHFEVGSNVGKETSMTQTNPAKSDLLGWSQYPEPTGTSYTESDLIEMETAIELLDRAQIFRAHITPAGWQWLWSHYKLQGLLALNRVGGWFDTENEDLAIDQLVRRSMIGGYDPIADGAYHPSMRSQTDGHRRDRILELIRSVR